MEEFQEIEYEVKEKNSSWKVFYPDEGDIQTQFPVFDRDGKLKTVVYSGGNSGKLTESFEEFKTAKEAVLYAKELGAEKVKLIKQKTRKTKKS